MANKSSVVPYWAIRVCLGFAVFLIFFSVLFVAGLAIYGDQNGMTIEQVWNLLWHIGESNPPSSQAITDVFERITCYA